MENQYSKPLNRFTALTLLCPGYGYLTGPFCTRMNTHPLILGIIGGGPAALFMVKRLAESDMTDLQLTIFEKSDELGNGMPYSSSGANPEHVTNVSDNEIPELHKGFIEWAKKQPAETTRHFGIDADALSPFHVLPRLLFGKYLRDEFRFYTHQG